MIRTERLWLRSWRDSDLEPFARLNADAEVMRYFTAPLAREESDEFAREIRAQIEAQGWGRWAVEIVDVIPFAGFIGLSRPRFTAHFTPCTEISWRLAADCWGHGYATEGALAALDFGFHELKVPEIVAFTTPANAPSRRVMDRIGMTHDPADDFDHPGLPADHPLARHVLYRKRSVP